MDKVNLKVVRQRKGWIVLRDCGSRTQSLMRHVPTEEEAVEFSQLFASNYNNRGLDVTVHLSEEAYEAARQRILFNKRG